MATYYTDTSASYYIGRKNDFTVASTAAPSVTYKAGTDHVDEFCRAWQDADAVSVFRSLDTLQPVLFYVPTQGAQPVFVPLPFGTEIALPVQVGSA